MKKIIILTIASLAFCTMGAFAANPGAKNITTDNLKIEQKGETVYVDFDITVGKRVARSGRTVVYRPYLVNGEHRWDLPEVVIQKPRAKVAEQRHEWVSGETVNYDNPAFLRGGEEFHYSITAPRQGWMDGANLEVEIMDMGCCAADTRTSDLIAENIDLPTPMAVVPVWVPGTPDVEPERIPITTGDMIAESMPFVHHASEFTDAMPSLMFDDDRESALKVYFSVSTSRLDPNMNNNAETLRLLLESIRQLNAAPDSHVAHIVLAGFASPEGEFQFNDRLAWHRATVLKRYILRNTSIDENMIHIYNGIEDWYGLRLKVLESGLANKNEIIDIIDTVPISDFNGRPARELALRKLDGGRTYSYMLKNFFPELRKAAYIKVYYDNNRPTK